MTDKELKAMDETTSMDTTAAAESAAEAVDVNEAVDDALLSDVDELAFDVDFDDDDADDDVTDVATDVIGTDDGDRDGNVDNSNVVDEDTDDVDDETTKVDTASAPAPADGGADVVAANADLLRAYPTLSLHDVTYRDRKTGRTPVEHLTCAFEAGTVSAILVPDGDDMARTAMVGLLSGLLMPESGHLMNRSAEYLSIEPFELRGHRIGLVPQRFAVRGDLSPVRNQPQLPQAQARVDPRTAAGVRTGRNAVG